LYGLNEEADMGDSVLRIQGYMPGYQGGGAGAAFVAPRHNRAQRFQLLFVAIESADLDAAEHAITALVNFDPKLAHDTDFTKLSRAVHDKHVYAAQHFAHEYQAKLAHQLEAVRVHSVPHGGSAHPAPAVVQAGEDGLPHIDTLA
jgi:hypothetical protein